MFKAWNTALILLAMAPAISGAEEIRHQLAADISAERLQIDIATLVGFGTRHTAVGDGIGHARHWRSASLDCRRIRADIRRVWRMPRGHHRQRRDIG